jgi:hypothetical protein
MFEVYKTRNKEMVMCSNTSENTDGSIECLDNDKIGASSYDNSEPSAPMIGNNSAGFRPDLFNEAYDVARCIVHHEIVTTPADTTDDTPTPTWKQKPEMSELERRLAEYQQQTSQLLAYRDDDFQVNHNPELLSYDDLTKSVGSEDEEDE